MILVPFDHAPMTSEDGLFPAGIMQQEMVGKCAHAMGFEIRLADDIQSVAIAEVIPERTIRIVARPDGIDVVLLHQLDIANHRFTSDDVAAFRQELVSINSLEIDGLSIQEQAPIPDLDLAKANVQRRHFRYYAAPISQLDYQNVKPRGFRRPLFNFRYPSG